MIAFSSEPIQSNIEYDSQAGIITGIILKAGVFKNSTDGEMIEITEQDLRRYVNNYNSSLKDKLRFSKDPSDVHSRNIITKLLKKINLYKDDLSSVQGIEVHLDHITQARATVGTTIGEMTLEYDDKDGQLGIKCNMLITDENIKTSIKHGALKYFSVGAVNDKLREVSLVNRGACPDARVVDINFSANKIDNILDIDKQIKQKNLELKKIVVDKQINKMIKLGSASPSVAKFIRKKLLEMDSVNNINSAVELMLTLIKPIDKTGKNLNMFASYENKGTTPMSNNDRLSLEDAFKLAGKTEDVNVAFSEVKEAPQIIESDNNSLNKDIVLRFLEENKIDELKLLLSDKKNIQTELAEKILNDDNDARIKKLEKEIIALQEQQKNNLQFKENKEHNTSSKKELEAFKCLIKAGYVTFNAEKDIEEEESESESEEGIKKKAKDIKND